ncbi:hypothetical protein O4159_02580 [Gordonia terrae]|uniref:hypothetical protein n=1 Tax=Gordonia hongkongensis TaxID=1701090 RepID=UPI0022B2EB7D|nr:hypothetical protein [Gordonia terrae]
MIDPSGVPPSSCQSTTSPIVSPSVVVTSSPTPSAQCPAVTARRSPSALVPKKPMEHRPSPIRMPWPAVSVSAYSDVMAAAGAVVPIATARAASSVVAEAT